MVTGELKSKIDSLWEIFWTGGLTNPLDVIEQMTYLMFIKDLDDADNLRAKEAAMLGLPYTSVFAKEVQVGDRTTDGNQLRWSVFHDFPAQKMYSTVQEWVFPFIKNIHGNKESAYSKYMDDAIFKVPTPLMLDKVVAAMDDIYEKMAQLKAADTRGDVYEYLLSKLATAGVNGQFRTPRHIIRMMVELMDPKADEVICDPASNSYGLLEATLPELGEFGRGVSKHRPRNDPKLLGGDYPLIQTGDVAAANLYITSYNSTYSELGLKQSKMWDKGTLCITIAANIAKTAILDFDACFPDSVVGFTANEKTNNIFIHYWFSFFQTILESQAPESAQKNINLKILSELKVIVPDKKKQDEFVAFIKQVDKSKVVVQKALDEAQLLFDSLMQQYLV